MISRLFSREPDTRIFFATDIHGSETCWRKFLNSGKHYEAKVMVLGGDMTGKALVPIVEQGAGRWNATLLENKRDFESEEEVKEFEDATTRSALLRTRCPSSSRTKSFATSSFTSRC
jgi:Icc-related predicted phosphoesterase